jgi:hypothetical protein
MLNLDTPCCNGMANFFLDKQCRNSICVDCIIESEYSKGNDRELDTYGMAIILNSAIPLDFTPNK